MPVLRSTALIDAPPRTVAGLLRDTELTAVALARDGHLVDAGTRLLAPGDEIRIGFRLLPGVRVSARMVVDSVSDSRLAASLVQGSAVPGALSELAATTTLTSTGAGTLVLDELRWTSPLGRVGRLADVALLRRSVLRVQAARMRVLAERAAALAGGRVVVATALHRDGRLLVAQRTRPPSLVGKWELPGGRVEAGESEADAVRRECREELGATVGVLGRLGTDLPIDGGSVLRVHVAELDPGSADPRPLEHAALRWVGFGELAALDWVPADRAVLTDLTDLLRVRSAVRPEA